MRAGATSAMTESPAKVTRKGSCGVGWRPPGGRLVVVAGTVGAVVPPAAPSSPDVHAAARAARSNTGASARPRRADIGGSVVTRTRGSAAGPGTSNP